MKQANKVAADSRSHNIVIADDKYDVNFERKLDTITAGGKPYTKNRLLIRISPENCRIIVNYIIALQIEISPAQTCLDIINKLTHFAEFHNPRSFKDITRQSFLQFNL